MESSERLLLRPRQVRYQAALRPDFVLKRCYFANNSSDYKRPDAL